jgi:hypothetical protein
MGKKENKLRIKFKKFIQKTTGKLQKIVAQGNFSSVVFLMRRKEDGVSYVKGDPLDIHILLEETASRDPAFAEILTQVASRLKNKNKDTGSFLHSFKKDKTKDDEPISEFQGIKSSDGDGVINSLSIDPDQLDKMTDEEIDTYLDKYTKDASDKYRRDKGFNFGRDDKPEE